MRDYAKVSPRFWIGETGRQIRAVGCHAQVLSFYLMTSPHANMLGLYYMPLPFIVHETGIPLEGASKALQSLKNVGFCSYDQETEFVWVHEMARFQIAEKLKPDDKRVIGIRNEYRELSNNPFLEPFFNKYQEAFGLSEMRSYKPPKSVENPPSSSDFDQTTKGQVRPFGGASMGHRSQEQEQEHEQEHEQEKTSCSEPPQPASAEQQVETPEQPEPAKVDPVPETSREVEPVASQSVLLHNDTVVIKIPLAGKRGEFAVTESMVSEWEQNFPAVDVRQQLRAIRQWNIDRPNKRKTLAGIRKHISSWLAKKQDGSGYELIPANRQFNGHHRTPAPDNFAEKDYQKDATDIRDLYWIDPEHRTEH